MPSTYIRRCEEEGYSWNEYGFELEWLEAAVPRDSQPDVAAMIDDRSGEFRDGFGEACEVAAAPTDSAGKHRLTRKPLSDCSVSVIGPPTESEHASRCDGRF
ncbi:MAG: hypothetical protein OEU26_27790, partial [Candidatus Tectomicrobia bacterium]|nr:hypothetical protein [Candidatus Tectomicrobia bacterium]